MNSTTIVMTGGTSGLGEAAARIFRETPGVRLLLGARGVKTVETLPLDLMRLASVREFAAQVSERVNRIDALVLNAGMSPSDIAGRTVDGFEPACAVNHLAHYLLLRLLSPLLAEGAIVAITTSGTHDPAERTPIPTPRHADIRLLARPELDPESKRDSPRMAGGRAYSSSKLCNILTARAFAAQRPDLTVIAYNPGPTPGTGLLRHNGALVNLVWNLLGGPLRFLASRLNSKESAGRALADLALGRIVPPGPGKRYASLRRGSLEWIEPSELARRDDLRDALWRDSAALVGLDG